MFNLAETDLSPQESAAWYDVLSKFRQVAAEFETAYRDIQIQPIPASAALAAERATLLQRFHSTANTVRQIRASLDDVLAALSGAWDRVSGVWDWASKSLSFNGGLQGLGLPIIPIAFVVSAVAYITYLLTDYAKYTKNVAVYNSALASGATPAQAAAVSAQVAASGGPSLASGLQSFGGGLVMLAAAVGAGLFFYSRRTRR